MSSKYNGWIITNEGKKLLSRTLENQTKFKITKLEVGNGYNNGDDKLLVRLNSLKNSYSVNAIDRKVDNTVEVTFVVSNRNSSGENIVNTSYRISEMGIYAKDDTEREILYAYTKSEQGDYLPTFIGSNPIDIIQKCYVITEQSQNITLTIDGTITYVTQPDFEEYKNNLKVELDKKSNKVDTVTDISVENNSLIFTKNNTQNRFSLVPNATETIAGMVTLNKIKELATTKINEFGIGTTTTSNIDINSNLANGLYVTLHNSKIRGVTTFLLNSQYDNYRYGVQLGITEEDNPTLNLRVKRNGIWKSWQLIPTESKVLELIRNTIPNLTYATIDEIWSGI